MPDTIFAAIALGYFLGAIPFGLVLTKLAGLGDVRDIGSGNIGATNVLRTGNKALALLTLALDGAKGAVAFLIVQQYSPEHAPYAGLAAFIGHLYPIWLKFKGGKGVATFIGLLAALNPALFGMVASIWSITVVLSRMSSLGALVSSAIAPILTYFLIDQQTALIVLAMTLLIFYRHQDNIRRIKAGEESKIGSKRD